MFIFPVQRTTSKIGNLTPLIHTLLYVMTIVYIQTCVGQTEYRQFVMSIYFLPTVLQTVKYSLAQKGLRFEHTS